ncbi:MULTISPECIES: YggT family protein [Methylococcus]|jgi:YggT family protein|uniref:YGGT family protein n=2 Tax=Methylococcus capsulatus TaxID=414 RepID=Q608F8_METCA|nr:YggT family protein [Methylococcus capsulatus]AAU92219.1 YGGT family protein [Methylococcus capsulatus str. Bath]QXP90869.1 YggT family protein [Methylococcus capsulatus]CAI8881646.1 YggT family protein [Methylococcus capsulatus]
MDLGYLVNPAVFLVETLFGLYIFAVLLRFLLQWTGADYYNPISQFLVKVTHPPLRLLRRFIPAMGRIDTASLVLMLVLQTVASYLVFLLQGAAAVSVAALAVWSVHDLLDLVFNIFFFCIIARALLSWFGRMPYHPAASLLTSLTEPLLRLSRRLLPPAGGLDFSPLLPLIGIQLARMLILPPLQHLAALLN